MNIYCVNCPTLKKEGEIMATIFGLFELYDGNSTILVCRQMQNVVSFNYSQ